MRRKEILLTNNSDEQLTQPVAQLPDHWAGFLLHRVATIARELYETNLARIGLRPSYVGILQLLAVRGPMVQAHLAQRLGIDKAAMVSYLNELENTGLVERRNHPDDRRAFFIHLRQKGMDQLSQIETVNLECSRNLFKGLTFDEQQTLYLLLKHIYDSFS